MHVDGDPAVLASRRAVRGASRDAHRPETPSVAPAIDVLGVDAELTTTQQLARLLPALGHRRPVDPGAAIFAREFDAVLFDLGRHARRLHGIRRPVWRRFAEHFDVSMQACTPTTASPRARS